MDSLNIESDSIKLKIKRITNFNTDHQEGWTSIPQQCIKIKHGNGYAWFGISILDYKNVEWDAYERYDLERKIKETLFNLTDVEEIVSDITRTVDFILEIVNERKTAALLNFNTVHASEYLLRNAEVENHVLLSVSLSNGVSLEVYESDMDPNSLSYGGFALELTTNKGKFPVMLFHRNVILNNYITDQLAQEITESVIQSYLGSLLDVQMDIKVIKIVERNRRPNK